ncbi:MAG TPA: PD-(D/E)XK nuclease-like domain-containing protein [Polyangiaceae bacterium]
MSYESIQALNWSTLKLLETSPRLLQFRRTTPRRDTESLHIGRAIHACLLEPEAWEHYVVMPEFSGKGSRAAKAEWLADRPGSEIISAEDYAMVERCAESIRSHREAMKLITGGRREEVLRWTDAETGIACKARLDIVRPRDLCELKSTRHGTPREFLRDASRLLYHGQVAWYHDGAIAAGALPSNADNPSVVAVQTTEPYDVMAFRLKDMDLSAGRALWQSLIRRFSECSAANYWPGVAPTLLDYDVMPWASMGDGEQFQEDQF